ncbi:hypothetical protein [Deltalipothrixvirus pozzuoliense]|uniref:Uncharacterized protein ORF413 n=1 Tax=Acidianus filamentous virus 2 (isolate Italy/Pozzuoli) TaxID=654910 RepID=Y413_AFV2P|nr:hypothetical protein AFV2_gp36 [Acidianus filamentous virus 2]Q573D3.1 RecName: Full=Uncharacterized protein ORF413 [Acidianus filamentous virus 2 (isolate Pozzuoli)]CAH69423.1 hypothetical protein [Acidianus filamentous virus 2]
MIYGEVTLTIIDNDKKVKIRKKNTIVNLSALLPLITSTTSTAGSIITPYIQTNAGNIPVTYSVQPYESGYVFIFTGSFSQPSNIISAFLYPSSLSTFQQPIASIVYSREITGVTSIEWAIYVDDATGLLYNALLPNIITSTNFLSALYADDGNTNALLTLGAYQHYVYAYFSDATISKAINYINAHYFTFIDYTTSPSAITIGNNFALQLVPASTGQHTVFYYLWNSQNFTMQFSFSSGSSPLADGFVVCMYATTPPIALNTSSVTGMTNGTLAYGEGNQICVEFDPYSSQPISVTQWNGSGYVSTLLSSSGAGTGTSMTANDIFVLEITVSGTTMTVTVTDVTANKTIASQSVTLPFTPPSYGYAIITARNENDYANWSLVNIVDWYPYSIQIPTSYVSPQLLPITAIFNTD